VTLRDKKETKRKEASQLTNRIEDYLKTYRKSRHVSLSVSQEHQNEELMMSEKLTQQPENTKAFVKEQTNVKQTQERKRDICVYKEHNCEAAIGIRMNSNSESLFSFSCIHSAGKVSSVPSHPRDHSTSIVTVMISSGLD